MLLHVVVIAVVSVLVGNGIKAMKENKTLKLKMKETEESKWIIWI